MAYDWKNITVEAGSMLLYLGKKHIDYYSHVHDRDEEEIRYLFLFDNQIIYSLDPGRSMFQRTFTWKLTPPCE